MTNPDCFSCGRSASEGLTICEQFLCPDCEAKIVRSKVGNLDYQHWVDSCRRFWEKLPLEFEQ